MNDDDGEQGWAFPKRVHGGHDVALHPCSLPEQRLTVTKINDGAVQLCNSCIAFEEVAQGCVVDVELGFDGLLQRLGVLAAERVGAR